MVSMERRGGPQSQKKSRAAARCHARAHEHARAHQKKPARSREGPALAGSRIAGKPRKLVLKGAPVSVTLYIYVHIYIQQTYILNQDSIRGEIWRLARTRNRARAGKEGRKRKSGVAYHASRMASSSRSGVGVGSAAAEAAGVEPKMCA